MLETKTLSSGEVRTFFDSWSEIGVPDTSVNERSTAVCPACSAQRKPENRSHKCLGINYTHGTAVCNHCGAFYQKRNSTGSPRYHTAPKQYRKPNVTITNVKDFHVMGFLGERRIPHSVQLRNKLFSDVRFFPRSKQKKTCLAFPYFKDNELVGVKYRSLDKEFTSEAGAEPTLYGYDDIGDVLIWVEGELDKLSVEAAGFKSCVSVPNGAGSIGSLEHAKDKISKVRRHVIAVDNDDAGSKLKNELINRLNPAICRALVFPDGCKDANDILVKFGAKALADIVRSARPVPINGVVKPTALLSKLIDSYNSDVDSGFSTGWDNVDRLYRVVKGQWTALTGIPNHGKSEWLDALVINMIRLHRWKFGIFSPENYPMEKHLAKLLRKILNKPFGKRYNGAMTVEEVSEKTRTLDDYISFVSTDDDNYDIDRLLKMIESLILSEGIDGMVVDPWNTIEHNRPRNLTETEYISSALTKITHLVRKHNIHCWVVAHPTKLARERDTRKVPVPKGYEISGSAHWANKADNIVTVHIDPTDNDDKSIVKIVVSKIRFRDNGETGETELRYDRMSGRYLEI